MIKNWESFTSGQTGTSGPPGLSLPLMTTAGGLGRQSMNLPFFRSLHPDNFPSICDLPPPKAHFFCLPPRDHHLHFAEKETKDPQR